MIPNIKTRRSTIALFMEWESLFMERQFVYWDGVHDPDIGLICKIICFISHAASL